jgi:hypothetical protein
LLELKVPALYVIPQTVNTPDGALNSPPFKVTPAIEAQALSTVITDPGLSSKVGEAEPAAAVIFTPPTVWTTPGHHLKSEPTETGPLAVIWSE